MPDLEDTLPPPPDYTIPGLRIQKNVSSGPWELVIRSAHRREDWVIYESRKPYEPLLLDTSIRYDGRFYRIHEEEESDSGWIYRLKSWPRGDIMFKTVELTAEKVAEVLAEKAEFERMEKLLVISIYYEILLGFLPARIQNKLAERLYFSPEHASRKNGLLEFFACFSLTALSLVLIFALKDMRILMLGCGFFVMALEGLVRWGHALASNEPLGLFLLEGIDWLYVRWKRRREG